MRKHRNIQGECCVKMLGGMVQDWIDVPTGQGCPELGRDEEALPYRFQIKHGLADRLPAPGAVRQ